MALNRFWEITTADPHLRRRGQTAVSLGVLLLLLLLFSIPVVLGREGRTPSLIAVGSGLALVGGAIALARRGHVSAAGWTLVLLSTVIIVAPSIVRREVSASLVYLALPVLIASVTLRPAQVWVALGVAYAGMAANVLLVPALAPEARLIVQNMALVLFVVAGIGFLTARLSQQAVDESMGAQQRAEAAALALEQTNHTLEAQVGERTASLQRALDELQARAAAQEELLGEVRLQRATIREMSTPVLPISRQVLVMPLVGAMDSARLHDLQEQALTALERRRARRLLLDITGVPVVDTAVAQGLIAVVEAARLLGAEVMLIGIRPEVAQAIVGLGVDLGAITTAPDLETALARN